jgi:hypothetical protein
MECLHSIKPRDVAVIKVHGENFRTLALGNSDQVQVGEEVVAIGNPLSLESTVSNGIVSGIRTAEEEGGKFLQVTAPISPGSSGGPLFNMAGEVVGITTLYLKGGENLNFAIPINDAKRLLLNQSAKLQNLPNEVEPEETPKETAAPITPTNTPNNPLPPNTKIAASPLDGTHATQEQIWKDTKYCYQNPANNLQLSNGTLVGCGEMNASLEARETECKNKTGPKDAAKHCKGFLKTYKELKAGVLSVQ